MGNFNTILIYSERITRKAVLSSITKTTEEIEGINPIKMDFKFLLLQIPKDFKETLVMRLYNSPFATFHDFKVVNGSFVWTIISDVSPESWPEGIVTSHKRGHYTTISWHEMFECSWPRELGSSLNIKEVLAFGRFETNISVVIKGKSV